MATQETSVIGKISAAKDSSSNDLRWIDLDYKMLIFCTGHAVSTFSCSIIVDSVNRQAHRRKPVSTQMPSLSMTTFENEMI